MASVLACWSDAPRDLLWMIIERLSFADYIQFGNTCIAWHTALAEKRCPPARQAPLLVLLGEDIVINTSLRFFSLSDSRYYVWRVPEKLSGLACIGCSSGMLVLSSKSELHLVDPISLSDTSLPSTTKFRGLDSPHIPQYKKNCAHYSMKLVVSRHLATSPASFVAAAVCELSNKMAVIRQGEPLWTTLEIPDNYLICNIIFFGEQLFAMSTLGHVVAYDVRDDPRITLKVNRPDVIISRRTHCLVESSGDLFQVWRRLDDSGVCITGEVSVFKMDSAANSNNWVEMKNLWGIAFFLGPSQAFSVSANEIKEIKQNNIYFVDTKYFVVPGFIKAYDMGHRSSERLPFKFDIKPEDRFPLFWFIPNFQ